MYPLTNKHFSEAALAALAAEQQIPDGYFEDFLFFLEHEIQQDIDNNETGPEILKSDAVKYALEDYSTFEAQVAKGHSKAWSRHYAISIEEHPHAFNDAYRAMHAVNPEQAKEELMIHCKAMGGDEYYTKHFMFLMEHGEAMSHPDKQAATYSANFKEQVASGKSEIFAHEYAENMAKGEYTEIYCHEYARCYEQALNEGKSVGFAQAISPYIAEYYANTYRRTNEIEYNDYDLLNESEIKRKYQQVI